MGVILFLKGLPASGKSFLANTLVSSDLSYKRINKDDIRKEFPNYKFSKEIENSILEIERTRGINYIKLGYNLIVDDTNFNPKHEKFWRNIAEKYKYNFVLKFMDASLEECIDRDSKRSDPVGVDVIKNMYNQYVKINNIKNDDRFIVEQDLELPHAYIFDIDGTLALINNRNPYDDTLAINDRVNTNVAITLENLRNSLINPEIIMVTGRQDRSRQVTIDWLNKNGIVYNNLYMRATGDNRPDSVVKEEIYNNYIKGNYYIAGVFDDRDSVVKLWRDLGLTCFQVYYGNF